jgi:hypothetical protein
MCELVCHEGREPIGPSPRRYMCGVAEMVRAKLLAPAPASLARKDRRVAVDCLLVSSVPLSETQLLDRPRRPISASSSRATRTPDNECLGSTPGSHA